MAVASILPSGGAVLENTHVPFFRICRADSSTTRSYGYGIFVDKTKLSMVAPVQDAIVLLGDSLTQGGWESNGFAQRLASAYVRKLDVINRGFSGYNTAWVIPVFEQCLARRNEQSSAQKIRILAIWFGANDASLPGFKQHIPLEKYGSNLVQLIRMVRDTSSEWYSPETDVILITPPPFNLHQWLAGKHSDGTPRQKDRDFEVTAQYAQKVREIGTLEKIPVADVWSALWNAAGQKEDALAKFLADGLHLTGAGYSIVYEELVKVIKENNPELYYENVREVFVRWDEIDPQNPAPYLTTRKTLD